MASIQQLGNVLAQAPLNLSENEEIYEIDYDNVSPDMPKWVFHAACVALASLGTFGIVANFIVFTLFVITPMIRTPFNYILMNMIFSDSCIAFYGVPVDFMASYGYGWKLGKKLCLTTGFILTTVGTVSICTLATLSVQRYMTLLCPERFKISSYSTSGFMVVSIWLYTFTVSVPPFFGWGEFVPETSGLTCAPDWESNRHYWYTWWWFMVGFIFPLLVIVITSTLTLNLLKEKSKSFVTTTIRRMSQRRDRRIASHVIWMNVSFLLCWMPYGVITCFYFFGGEGYVTPAVVVIPLMTAKSSVCWNPIIYVAMNPQFRGAFRRFIKSHRTRKMERRWDRIQRSGKATTKPVKKIQLPFVSAKDRLSLSLNESRIASSAIHTLPLLPREPTIKQFIVAPSSVNSSEDESSKQSKSSDSNKLPLVHGILMNPRSLVKRTRGVQWKATPDLSTSMSGDLISEDMIPLSVVQ